MLRLLKALPVTLAIAAVSIVATSCGSNNGTKARFFNAIQNTSAYGGGLDVEVNGAQQFTNVQFANASASTYTPIPSGNVTFEGFESPGRHHPSLHRLDYLEQRDRVHGGCDWKGWRYRRQRCALVSQ